MAAPGMELTGKRGRPRLHRPELADRGTWTILTRTQVEWLRDERARTRRSQADIIRAALAYYMALREGHGGV